MKLLIVFLFILSACGSDVVPNSIHAVDSGVSGVADLSSLFDTSSADADIGITNDAMTTPPAPLIVDEDNRTLRPNELVECSCPNPEDACSVSYSCVLKTHGCFVDEDCPAQYRCFENLCANQLDAEFFPTCVVDENCPFYYKCYEGFCSVPPSCQFSQDCSANEICGEIPNFSNTVCTTPGPNAADEACESGYECASGFCTEGKCRTVCVRNGDCSEEYFCELNGICSLTPYAEFRALCGDEVEATAINTDGCASQLCRVNADCPLGTCINAYCADIPSSTICKPNEFYYQGKPELCFIQSSCDNDAMCPSAYTCVQNACARPA